MSKFSDYLKKHKIDPRRVIAASKPLEALQPEDRIIRLAREQAKDGDETKKELAAKPRRSGRPVAKPTLDRALLGKPISRKARARVTRAVNAVLTQKKKTAVTNADLF